MAGLPQDVKAAMRTTPETCKGGAAEGVKKLLEARTSPGIKDARGISAVPHAGDVERLDVLKPLPADMHNKSTRLGFNTLDAEEEDATYEVQCQPGLSPPKHPPNGGAGHSSPPGRQQPTAKHN